MTTDDSEIEVPPFFCPIELRTHPDIDLISEKSFAWMESRDYFGHPEQRKVQAMAQGGRAGAWMTPSGATERIQPFADLNCWLLGFDNAHVDRQPKTPVRVADVAHLTLALNRAVYAPGTNLSDDGFVTALADLSERFRAISTPVQHRRWVEGCPAYFAMSVLQLANEAEQHIQGLDTYLAYRISGSALSLAAPSLEIVNGPEIPANEWASPVFSAIGEMSYLVALLDNDIISYRKEKIGDETTSNVINVIALERGIPVQAAVEAARSLRDRIMCRLLALLERTLPKVSEVTRVYLADMAHTVRSILEYQREAGRYLMREGEIRITETPTDSSTEPPPLSSITWWWDPALQ
ncbi:hypothetical protein [Streptomyces sp. NPDC093589]|uniref:terpene synthase family protein n=1 Tax=Streptomyces sp. NPDC093589 TaxID=3366043 RepID=UPI00381C1927